MARKKIEEIKEEDPKMEMGAAEQQEQNSAANENHYMGEGGVPAQLQESAQTFTQEQVEAMIAQAVAKATAQVHKDAGEPMVTMLYLAEVSPEDILELPNYGTLRPHSYLEVSKREFSSKFMTALARKLIDRRYLLVVDGLTQEERQRWNCDYKAGEIMDERVFDKMLDYPTDQIADIFRHLCPEHREFVAKRFISAAERKDNRVALAKVTALNDICKESGGEELFRPVIESFKANM